MRTIRITGVPEHFNLPWKNVIARQPFKSEGIQLEWIEESRGSGQMNKAIRENETEIALILTESFLQDFENGNPSKMIGFHVKSPLIWGIHIPGSCEVDNLSEIKEPSFLISRMGSGSQLMSFVLAKREGWQKESLNFKIVGNLPGALEAMSPEDPDMFLWEKYTTKAWVDSGDFKRIGEVPSPWSCFVIVASNKALETSEDVIIQLRDLVYEEAAKLQKSEDLPNLIHNNYDLAVEDVKAWLSQTTWATTPEVSRRDMDLAMNEMAELGILKNRLRLEDFLVIGKLSLIE
ncbi:type 2 periplasmic-binding domain-containing protein [Algoriphagus pacificus]|uniref:ABC transporter substrate-binding protein n=1 Tax=Algoriphagus pacificus TaxID=2811234 RepID=A0ABS3CJS8_9BACT|nr:ABC transporter substrate-binding protein [Algoriphagus pacificus]MBN7815904.1 ABC transporter substrate-binding protein [Algoriphagus pacificus]